MLGLKAFVLAHPYDVPKWLPDLLLLLVRASFQPAPIKTSVRCLSFLGLEALHWEYATALKTSTLLYCLFVHI